VLEIGDKGSIFLRDPKRHLVQRPDDAGVPKAVIEKHGLRGGELLTGTTQPGEKHDPSGAMLPAVDSINGVGVDEWTPPALLQDMVAIDPHEPLRFETPGGPKSMWCVDMFTPIGRGQRGLIVAPPRTGKTILLQQMAHGIAENHPDTYMIVLLIDERPEEVTEMRRNVRGEVVASSNDLTVESHVRVARLVIERAKRMVEMGRNVVVLLDSITRLARAFNNYVGSSGRTMTGGLDIRALQEPKQFFGAARAIENGGSLTIIASALIDTGSRADNFIFEEFKGTGNMELHLDREMANLRVWPAINIQQSGTRKEEKLISEKNLQKIFTLRRQLHDLPPTKGMQVLLERAERYETCQAFLDALAASGAPTGAPPPRRRMR